MSSDAVPPPRSLRTGLAMASLVIGLLSVPTIAGLLIGGLAAIVLGIVALVKANSAPAEYGGKGLAIGGIVCGALSFVMIPFLGIIAGIAIPSLLRARMSANEAAAIAAVHTVVVAEATYESAYGSYAPLECLADPASCAPGRDGAKPFLDHELATEVRTGYRHRFHPGRLAAPSGPGSRSARAFALFAFVAEPVTPYRTGVRSICGDSSGRVCAVVGAMPEISDGQCPESCQPLR